MGTRKTGIELVAGNRYIIDAKYQNGGEVILVSFGNHFCIVKDPETGSEWQTMVYRLSEMKNEKEIEIAEGQRWKYMGETSSMFTHFKDYKITFSGKYCVHVTDDEGEAHPWNKGTFKREFVYNG